MVLGDTRDVSIQRMKQLGLTDLSVSKLWVHALFVGDSELDLLDPTVDRLGHCSCTDAVRLSSTHKRLAQQGFDVYLVQTHLHATTP